MIECIIVLICIIILIWGVRTFINMDANFQNIVSFLLIVLGILICLRRLGYL